MSRNTCPAFGFDAKLQIADTKPHVIKVRWENQGYSATLEADLKTLSFEINATEPEGGIIYQYMVPERDK